MRGEQFFIFLGKIDEDMLLASDNMPHRSKRPLWAAVGAVAACLLITIGIFLILPVIPTEYDIDYERYGTYEGETVELEVGNVWIYYEKNARVEKKYARMPLSIKNVFDTWRYLNGIDDDVRLLDVVEYGADHDADAYTVEISTGDIDILLVISGDIREYKENSDRKELLSSLKRTMREYLEGNDTLTPWSSHGSFEESVGDSDTSVAPDISDPPAESDTSVETAPPPPEIVLPNYGGRTFVILSGGTRPYNDFDLSASEPTSVGKVNYERTKAIETTLGVKLELRTLTDPDPFKWGGGARQLANSYASGEDYIDMALVKGRDAISSALSGHLSNINAMRYIDTTGVGWDRGSVRDFSIYGRLYYINGWVSAAQTQSAGVRYINRAIVEGAGLDDPYDQVLGGRWTYDRLEEYAKVANAAYYPNVSGMYGSDDSLLHAMAGGGAVTVATDSKGELVLTVRSENARRTFDAYTNLMYSSYATRSDVEAKDPPADFGAGRVLIMTGYLSDAEQVQRMSGEYAILPYPKLLEGSDIPYYTMLNRYTAQYVCFPYFLADREMSSLVAQTLAVSGEQLLKPAAFIDLLAGSIDSSDSARDVLDVVFSSMIHDIGMYVDLGGYDSSVLSLYRRKSRAFSSAMETILPGLQESVDAINEQFANYD